MIVRYWVHFLVVFCSCSANELTEEDLQNFLQDEYEKDLTDLTNKFVAATFNFVTDLNNSISEQNAVKSTLEMAELINTTWHEKFENLDTTNISNAMILKQLEFFNVPGNAILEKNKLEQLSKCKNKMIKLYGTGKICPFENKTCTLEKDKLSLKPELQEIMAESTNYEELEYVWTAWRAATGKKMRADYKQYVDLSNEAAKLNGFNDTGQMWKESYQIEKFDDKINELWGQVQPLYDELHKYVGRKLKKKYGDTLNMDDGVIPAHVFGNMWAQSWINLQNLVKPYPRASDIDITKALKEQDYLATKMFSTVDKFYESLGFESCQNSYDELKQAIISKRKDKEILCHASAYDFSTKEDFRVKMCTKINHEDFVTIHEILGNIQYFISYKDQPIAFRNGANPSFYDAVGGAIALSATTPKHLQEIGLLNQYKESPEADLNFLMSTALQRVAFLPFGYLVDKWRWDVFANKTNESEWNDHWWSYREKIQKIKSPVAKSADDFDPGSYYHVAADSQHISSFLAHILQFQLYESFCKLAKEYPKKPLHKCDFYRNREVGSLLKKALAHGSSNYTADVLCEMIKQKDLDGSAILNYFKPLYDYLQFQNNITTEEGMREYLENDYEGNRSTISNKVANEYWDYATDIKNEAKRNATIDAVEKLGQFIKDKWETAFVQSDFNDYKNDSLKRQVKLLNSSGYFALESETLRQLTTTIDNMTHIYSTAKICPYSLPECDVQTEGISLKPDIEKVFAQSFDYEELKYTWTEWHDTTGKNIRELYETYVSHTNQAAVDNSFSDNGAMWRSVYEFDTFEEDMEKLWLEVQPLYDQMHSYVAKKLKEHYGDQLEIENGMIPAHVLGNLWGESWINLASITRPYPDADSINITALLLEKEYNQSKMFEVADEFYTSLGLDSSAMSYVNSSVIVKPDDKEIFCHPSAWDFSDKKDFRIKMCAQVNYEDFLEAHSQIGYIQYYMLYKDQPVAFRSTAPGIDHAIGDTIALSVTTSNHLQQIKLLDSFKESKEADINTLMDTALEKLAFLPFGYLVDKWRWDVFSGKVNSSNWNDHWWHYKKTIQKVKPAAARDSSYFDPGALYHIPGDAPFINYFIAQVLEFQLYRSMCITAGQYDPNNDALPLYKCDFYNSTEVGEQIKKGLSLGRSQPWQEVLKIMTGEDNLNASAIVEYFQPLLDYFKNEDLPYYVNNLYETEASKHTNALTQAQWNFVTDVKNETAKDVLQKTAVTTSIFKKAEWTETFRDLNESDYTDETFKRQIKYLKDLGDSALDEDKLSKLVNAGISMTTTFSTTKICPYGKEDCELETDGLGLEHEIQSILAQSRDYDELSYIWSEWRKATRAEIKDNYQNYVSLSNEAAVINGFQNKEELWRFEYDSPTFVKDMELIWEQVKPLYNELHRYISKKLETKYLDKMNTTDGLLPAHVFGSVLAESWINIADLVKPYPHAIPINITQTLIDKNYTVEQMFQLSNYFYTSMGLETCNMSFGEHAVIEEPENEIVCQASAWDFADKKDYRIKMCAKLNYQDFLTIHRQMGHIEYYILYQNQPIAFRDGANPGFHSAVGDAIALSASTFKHLKKINLLDNYEESVQVSLNTLMDVALERVASLPFGLLVDKWKADVFSGKVTPEQWNAHWWYYREKIQKVKSPVPRDDQNDFDPGASYQVVKDSKFTNNFFANILQFQLFKDLCIKQTNGTTPNCDFSDVKIAESSLRAGLMLGKSKPWKDVLEAITGSRELNADALLEYFNPLFKFLTETNGPLKNETDLKKFLRIDYEDSTLKITHNMVVAEWNYATNVSNPDTKKEQSAASLRWMEFNKFYDIQYFKPLNESDYEDLPVRRQIKRLKVVGNAALDNYTDYVQAIDDMANVYSNTKICPFSQPNCELETLGLSLKDVEVIMASSTNYEELQQTWNNWHVTCGGQNEQSFSTYVVNSNEAAVSNGFKDKGEMWRSMYDTPTFTNDIDTLWTKVEPLYKGLHTQVAQKLKAQYGDKLDISDNLLPAHLLGNMWGETWTNIFHMVKPFPTIDSLNVTDALQNQNYTPFTMFESANKFYVSLGLESAATSYNESLGAVIQKPTDGNVICHRSAWDFFNGKDFRIKMCTEVNHEDFLKAHTALAHIQYFLSYKDQPRVFRDAPIPGFHDAVGNALALSVSTPPYLKDIGLIANYENTEEASINTLTRIALEHIPRLPFGLAIDKWKWDVFNGSISREEWNNLWWNYKRKYQGIKEPTIREPKNFDPGAQHHVIEDVQSINIFVSHILQYQIHKALCKEAGQESVPLHQCNLYNSKEAGAKLKKALILGASRHWSEVLKELIGESELNADAMLEYFNPLMEFWKTVTPPPAEVDSVRVAPIVIVSIVGTLLIATIVYFRFKQKSDPMYQEFLR